MSFLLIREPNMTTISPAMMNREPASMIRDAVSSGPIPKSSYAILIAGVALPQRMQQKSAAPKVTGNHAHKFFFLIVI